MKRGARCARGRGGTGASKVASQHAGLRRAGAGGARGHAFARNPGAGTLAVELSEVADGRRELGAAYAAAAAALSADETGKQALLGRDARAGRSPGKADDGHAGARAVRAAGQQRLSAGDVCPVPVSAFRPIRPCAAAGAAAGCGRGRAGYVVPRGRRALHRSRDGAAGISRGAAGGLRQADGRSRFAADRRLAGIPDGGRASAARRSRGGFAEQPKRTARNILSQYADSSFRPLRMEFVFGQNGLSPIVPELSDGTFVYLQGGSTVWM